MYINISRKKKKSIKKQKHLFEYLEQNAGWLCLDAILF